jgi:integrase
VIRYGGYAVGSIRRAFRNTAAEAGFNDVTPYTLRHTATTWMAQDGVDLWEIAGYMGTSIKMVEKNYAHHHPRVSEARCGGDLQEAQGGQGETQGPERQAGPADARSGPRNKG